MSQLNPGSAHLPRERALGIVFVYPVVNGPWAPAEPGASLTLGRDPGSDVPLEGKAVSWQHAELRATADGTLLRDLDSTNGLLVNGASVSEALLERGAIVRLGEFIGVVAAGPRLSTPRAYTRAAGLGMQVGPVLADALAPLWRAAAGHRPVVIEGETGTGKALAARLLHAESGRPGRLVSVDCALGAQATRLLLGDEGDRRGAGAVARAKQGTLVLTEIGALPPAAQRRLLGALDEAGDLGPRLVVTSQEPAARMAETGRLCPELGERLAALTIRIPPLRERLIDVPGLFQALLAAQAEAAPVPALSAELIERLCLYDWPFNVRELVLLARRLWSLYGDEDRLRAAHLPSRMQPRAREKTTDPVAPVGAVDLGALLAAVRAASGDVNRAAVQLGISRERAYRLLDRMGVQTAHLDG